ncbi:MAG: Hpt domain-containing protein [Planctomycetaceae bacterium]|nr:Hpt domain-containing protein [Planctomycetaceae bacterium]
MSSPMAGPSQNHLVPADAGIDLPAALSRLGGDAELLRELALIVVQDLPEVLRGVHAGLKARDHESAARAAHSLKGLAANFSEPAARAAQEAEDAFRNGNTEQARGTLPMLEAYIERLLAELQRTVIDR